MDYHNVATTVFTPLEYGCVGYSEDDAILTLGNDAVDVRHSTFLPLEWSLTPERSLSSAFAKVLVKKDDDKVVGLHFLGPNAGEVIQGYAVAMKVGDVHPFEVLLLTNDHGFHIHTHTHTGWANIRSVDGCSGDPPDQRRRIHIATPQ